VLLDPYAKAFTGRIEPGPECLAYMPDSPHEPNSHDSAQAIQRCIVIDESFDWGDDAHPQVPWEETLIYEAHVKGFTKMMPGVDEHLRGTYAGLGSSSAVAHLKRLGITAIELLPIHAHLNDQRLRDMNLSNYWGYNTIGFFAPEPSYAAARHPSDQVKEFKTMVRSLHAAGIEVLLDVVFNHTGEGNHLGPTVCFRGIDNRAYYRLRTDNMSLYDDVTGTGNTISSSWTAPSTAAASSAHTVYPSIAPACWAHRPATPKAS
jgi:glycogen operon protein